jgi:hypothetical protein
MVGAERHAPKCAGGMDCVLAGNNRAATEQGGVVRGGTCGEEHGGVFRLT